MSIQITNNFTRIKGGHTGGAMRALRKCGLTAEKYAKLMRPADTGNLRNSISHAIDQREMKNGS